MKKIIIILLSAIILFNGCSITNRSEELENEYSGTFDDGIDNSFYEFKMFFKDKLGYDIGKISPVQLNKIKSNYRQAQSIYEREGYCTNEILMLESEVNQLLRKSGYEIPLQSLVDTAEYLKLDMSESEYNQLIDLSSRSLEELDEKQIEEIIVEADKIVSKYGLSAKELIEQSCSTGIQLGLYHVREGKISRNNLDTVVDKEQAFEINKEHQLIWNEIESIIPSKYMAMINEFEINTDGIDEITAYVDSSDTRYWRISVDIRDIFGSDGDFTSYSINTIIHELAHIISLNSEQMTDDISDESLYTVEEGTLKKDSYLNQFYHRFWEDIIEEHSQSDEFEFFENHIDEFITDYAATNPGEDFAESFAYFVTSDKPSDDNIKFKKILFFYEYPEFITMRDDIRSIINN